MKRRKLAIIACIAALLCGCAREGQTTAGEIKDKLTVVGFSQVGAESEWRVANTESIKAALCEENGYYLIFDDARQEQENQIRAIRSFIQQDVDYIVFSPKVETGWKTVLQEAKDAGIPVVMIDRDIERESKELLTAYIGSDFRKEGEKAVKWLENLLERQGRKAEPIRIVHIQGTIGSSAQIGRTVALEQAIARNPNWELVAQECGDFTRAKAYEVMGEILKLTKDIDVVYCENDGEALGAIDAMEEVGLKCNAEDGVIVISFDATRLALKYCLEGKIALDVECNPLQGPYVDRIIKKLESGEPVEREIYIEETQFDCFTITQEMIDNRKY
ncbi:MAG: ABC transporter substrate-binding protein [Bacillota bacterium]